MIPILRWALRFLMVALPAYGQIKLPPDILPVRPTVADEENAILILEARLKPLTPEDWKKVSALIDQERELKVVVEPQLGVLLEERHRQANEILRPPLLFPRRLEFPGMMAALQLFKSADLLARLAAERGDPAAAETIRIDMLRWSALMRHGQPTLMEFLIPALGWRLAFSGMLSDWETADDQIAALAKIRHLYQTYPIEMAELIPVFKREAEYFEDMGGSRKWVEDSAENPEAILLLNPPFENLTFRDLLDLPHDRSADVESYSAQVRGRFDAVTGASPIQKWPGMKQTPRGKSLDDYRKRPNGLGDFLEDHLMPLSQGPLVVSLFYSPAMDTCLRWLDVESEGGTFSSEYSGIRSDPGVGTPLVIHPAERLIHCFGGDYQRNVRKLEQVLPPGFHVVEDDFFLVVPKWRDRK